MPEKNYAEQYREKLVDMVRETGKYIEEHADDLVDKVEMKTDFSISIDFPQDGVSEISITQSHFMRNVIEVATR